jgi:CheY-like chemotaxis protein
VDDLLRKRAKGRALLLIAITGRGQEEDRARSLAAGFDAHLTKPVEIADLVELLAARQT